MLMLLMLGRWVFACTYRLCGLVTVNIYQTSSSLVVTVCAASCNVLRFYILLAVFIQYVLCVHKDNREFLLCTAFSDRNLGEISHWVS